MEKILFVDACVRRESRTRRLAACLLAGLPGEVERVALGEMRLMPLDEETLEKRNALLTARAYDHPMFDLARQFAAADTIVMAAPFWDLSLPACLKTYIEWVNVVGVTFRYGAGGATVGLCRAKRLIYVSSAGGMVTRDMGYEYVQALCETLWGIPEIRALRAEGLDIDGADVPRILEQAEDAIRREYPPILR